uniref:Myb/SANT-like domain-containing protein n=1 Tax=Schizophyllum commune (strain H4-8 / FGSC 9210) TaxID=578458 RepID=D8Q2T7_SCHCM
MPPRQSVTAPSAPPPDVPPAKTAEAILKDTLKKCLQDGLGTDSNFKKQHYARAALALQAAGFNFSPEQVKTRWMRYKRDYNFVKELRKESGFGWDEETKMVVAEEAVWDALMFTPDKKKTKKHKDYNYWKKHAFPDYDDIAQLVGDAGATGGCAFSSVSGTAAAPTTEQDAPQPGDEEEEIAEDDEDALDLSLIDPQLLQRAGSPPPSVSSKRVRTGDQISQLFGRVDITLDKIADSFVSPPAAPSTPPASSSSAISPLRRLCWKKTRDEGLSPHSLGRSRRVFRDDVKVKEYLGFDDDDEQDRMARSAWLADEINAADR